MCDRLRKIWQIIFVRVPAQYARAFLDEIAADNIQRIMIGGGIVSLIELGVFIFAAQRGSVTVYYPLTLIGFNALVISFIVVFRQWLKKKQIEQWVVFLTAVFHLGWANFYTWGIRLVSPSTDISLPLFMLMAYGIAVFIVLEPLWSSVLYFAGFGLFVGSMPYQTYEQVSIIGNIWNALALCAFSWVTSRLIFAFRLRTFIAQRELEQEQAKSDALLLNILPAKIVTDLKETGHTEPERFEQVTILFSDLVNFTDITGRMRPDVLINELNDLFTAFDMIAGRHNCERIKTIGDAYLCVCGMPQPDPNHTQQILNVALEMIAYLQERNANQPQEWQIRIGIHTGNLIGGVVGTQKYIYDVFGDTINFAERLQAHSVPMQINVSEDVHRLARDSYLFAERGPIQVKGKGEAQMYFCKGLRENKE